MAITNFDNLVIDRVVDAWFESKSTGDLLAVLDQISNFSINTTSETKDKTDAQGALLKRYFTSKSVEVSGENATFSLNLFATQNGVSKVTGTDVVMPRIFMANKSDSPIDLPDIPLELDPNYTGTVTTPTLKVYGTSENGNADVEKKYTKDTTAGAGTYTVAVVDKPVDPSDPQGETKKVAVLTLPTDATDAVQIKYEYKVSTDKVAARVNVQGDKFPKECKATFRVLCSDLCDSEEVLALYIVFEKFQMSPDFDWTVDTESTQNFSATAFKDYCAKNQVLYYIAVADDTDDWDTKQFVG